MYLNIYVRKFVLHLFVLRCLILAMDKQRHTIACIQRPKQQCKTKKSLHHLHILTFDTSVV